MWLCNSTFQKDPDVSLCYNSDKSVWSESTFYMTHLYFAQMSFLRKENVYVGIHKVIVFKSNT